MNLIARRAKAFTLIEIMIVVAITGIIISIAVPAWLRAREQASARACQENLSKIEGAKEVYTLEFNLRVGASVQLTDLYASGGAVTGYIRKKPNCPAGGTYSANVVGVDPTCSYNGSEFFSERAFLHVLP